MFDKINKFNVDCSVDYTTYTLAYVPQCCPSINKQFGEIKFDDIRIFGDDVIKFANIQKISTKFEFC